VGGVLASAGAGASRRRQRNREGKLPRGQERLAFTKVKLVYDRRVERIAGPSKERFLPASEVANGGSNFQQTRDENKLALENST